MQATPLLQKSIARYGGYGYNNEYDNNYGGQPANTSWGSGSERQSLPRNTASIFEKKKGQKERGELTLQNRSSSLYLNKKHGLLNVWESFIECWNLV